MSGASIFISPESIPNPSETMAPPIPREDSQNLPPHVRVTHVSKLDEMAESQRKYKERMKGLRNAKPAPGQAPIDWTRYR